MNSSGYILIQGWMLNELNLKGNALLVFAIIYGFSKDGESEFKGSIKYLCDATGSSKNTVMKALSDLVDLDYITKKTTTINSVIFNTYHQNERAVQKLVGGGAETGGGVVQKLEGGSAETGYNNTIYTANLDNTIDKEAPEAKMPDGLFDSFDTDLETEKNEKGKPGPEKKDINKALLIKVIESDVEEGQRDNFKIAMAFYHLFYKNLKDAGSTTAQLDKVTYKGFVDPIRLMVERDNITREQFITLYEFLKVSDFWKDNVLSTSKLRIQASKLLMQANKNLNGKSKQNGVEWADDSIKNSGAGTGARLLTREYLESVAREISGH